MTLLIGVEKEFWPRPTSSSTPPLGVDVPLVVVVDGLTVLGVVAE